MIKKFKHFFVRIKSQKEQRDNEFVIKTIQIFYMLYPSLQNFCSQVLIAFNEVCHVEEDFCMLNLKFMRQYSSNTVLDLNQQFPVQCTVTKVCMNSLKSWFVLCKYRIILSSRSYPYSYQFQSLCTFQSYSYVVNETVNVVCM